MARSSYQSISDEFPGDDNNGRRGSNSESDSDEEQDRNWRHFVYGI